MKLGLLLALLALLALAANPARAGEADDEDALLAAFFRSYLDEVFRAEPMTATRLGDHRFDDRLDDLSAEARAANRARDRKALADLPKRIDAAKLSPAGRVDYGILRQHLEREVWLAEHFDPFADDPRIYGDYLTESIYLPLALSSLPKETNRKNVRQRMAQIPAVVAVARATIGRPPKVKVETAIRQTKGAIAFYEKGLFDLTGEPPGRGLLGERAAAIVTALNEHLAFLQDRILPRATEDWRIGRDKFVRKLELELDAGLTADEVLQEAGSEAARVEREMALIARMLWGSMFPKEAVPPDDEAGRRALIRRVLDRIADEHGRPETLVADARATVAEIKAFIADRDILRLPDPDHCRVVEMPEFKRGNSVAYLESAPPLDPKGTSEYAISPPPADWTAAQVESYLREYNRAMLKILTIHEAYPGHYVQLEYSNRCPSFIRRVLQSGTFAEGWAVYTEQMMLDQGFGHGDPKLRLQQLKFYLRAVVNAILDHQMHCGTMTDDQAKELLMGRAFQTEGEALGKITRAKQTSCQLSTYFVGRTAFNRLRQSIQRELGDRFHLGRFHEAVLAHGTLPVKYLPELVRGTILAPAPR
jgi:uncharacterized protein (DUF885 family)